MNLLEIIKLQARKSKGVFHYTITVPKTFVKELGWEKGNPLVVKIVTYEGKKGLFVYKPKLD